MRVKFIATEEYANGDNISLYRIDDVEDMTEEEIIIELRAKGYAFKHDKGLRWYDRYVEKIEKRNGYWLMSMFSPRQTYHGRVFK